VAGLLAARKRRLELLINDFGDQHFTD